jgi:hypothetical protein
MGLWFRSHGLVMILMCYGYLFCFFDTSLRIRLYFILGLSEIRRAQKVEREQPH